MIHCIRSRFLVKRSDTSNVLGRRAGRFYRISATSARVWALLEWCPFIVAHLRHCEFRAFANHRCCLICAQTWSQQSPRPTGHIVKCHVHQKLALQNMFKAISWLQSLLGLVLPSNDARLHKDSDLQKLGGECEVWIRKTPNQNHHSCSVVFREQHRPC